MADMYPQEEDRFGDMYDLEDTRFFEFKIGDEVEVNAGELSNNPADHITGKAIVIDRGYEHGDEVYQVEFPNGEESDWLYASDLSKYRNGIERALDALIGARGDSDEND